MEDDDVKVPPNPSAQGDQRRPPWESADADAAMRTKLCSIAAGAIQRARKRSLPVDADLAALTFEIYAAQGARCALTGIQFDLCVVGTGQARRPFAPSLDRIDSSEGYTRDNTRLVCQAVNFALNAFGEDVFREIALAAAEFVPEQVRPTITRLATVEGEQLATDAERERKRQYIRHVVEEAPHILAEHGGCIEKVEMRSELRRRYPNVLPIDEANAYGWGFRRLTEAGTIEPASGSDFYTLRSD
jgi:hypothetical protein